MEKKILVFTDWYYPAFKAGGPVRSVTNMVNVLSDQFDFYIFTGDRDLNDSDSFQNISFNTWKPLGKNNFVYYSQPELHKKRLAAEITKANADVVYFNSMFSVNFTLYPLIHIIRHKLPGKIVLAPRGMLHAGALKLKLLKKKIFIGLLNFFNIPAKITFHATDEQEKRDILKNFPGAKEVVVVGNIPDTSISAFSIPEKIPSTLRIVFLSRIQQKKNLLMFLKLLNEFKAPPGAISFDIYGSKEDATYWKQIEESISSSPHTIRFMGEVEHEQVMKVLSFYHLFVLPTHGENFGHSIYEALKAGVPVLISDQTPWRNLQEFHAGWDIPLNEPDKYINALKTMLDLDQQSFDRYVQGAKALANKYIQDNNFVEDYKKLFSDNKASFNSTVTM